MTARLAVIASATLVPLRRKETPQPGLRDALAAQCSPERLTLTGGSQRMNMRSFYRTRGHHERARFMTTTKKQLVQEFRMQAIREAASCVVSEHGVAGATMEAIAAEAGIAKGTIYLYFKNREDLLERAADHALEELLSDLGALFDSEDPFESQLRRFVRSALSFFDENRQFFRLYQAAGQSTGRDEADCRSRRYEDYFVRLTAWVRRAMAAGEVRPLDAERVSLVLSEALTAVIRRRRLEDPPPPVDADTEWLATLFLDGALSPRKERT